MAVSPALQRGEAGPELHLSPVGAMQKARLPCLCGTNDRVPQVRRVFVFAPNLG